MYSQRLNKSTEITWFCSVFYIYLPYHPQAPQIETEDVESSDAGVDSDKSVEERVAAWETDTNRTNSRQKVHMLFVCLFVCLCLFVCACILIA